jgi:DNA-binding MarR family transcriptional regulator
MQPTSNTTQPTAVEDLVKALYRLGVVQREIARHALDELGSQGFFSLGVVSVHGPIRVSDVARRLNVDLSVASRQVAALTAAGYVQRERDPEDRRAQRVSITDAGNRVLSESHRRMVHAFSRALEDWSPDDLCALSGQLERLRHDVQADLTAPVESKGIAA